VSTKQPLRLPGRTNNLLAFWQKYKSAPVIVVCLGGTVVVLYFYWAAILKTLGGGLLLLITAWAIIKSRRLKPYPLFVKEIQMRRSEIERLIGTFDMPNQLQVATTASNSPLTYRRTVDYAFLLRGSLGSGTGAMRLVRVERQSKNVHPFDQPIEYVWEVEKLRIELQGISGLATISEKKRLHNPKNN